MNSLVRLVVILISSVGFAQHDLSVNDISEAEMKAAMSRMAFQANANTGNYDLTYHRLEFTVDPNVNFINGDVTSYFIAKEDLTQVIFDLDDNLTVSQVLQDGNSLSFSQNTDDELIITLPQVQNQGVLDSLTISYSGSPSTSGFGAFTQTYHNSDPIIWTLSEPYGAKNWWPCKQDLIDKVDVIDVFITSPQFNPSNDEYIAVSNGVEQSQVINGMNKTTHFRHQFPIPAYLIAIAVTNYDVFSQQVPNNGNPFDIINYVFPESLADAQLNTPVTVDIMNLFIDLFEPYPYEAEKYGHAEFTRSGGMEHTTVSFMGNYSRNLIAHELAHQWFGDKITCGSWKDIWLNEGFATYLSGLVVEELDGNAAFTSWKQARNNFITAQPDGYVYLTDQDTTSVSRIFNGRLTYNKAAMVLHMLRKKLGEIDFYQGVQDYLAHPDLAFGYAKTEDFIPIMELASGQNLTEFFDDWLFKEGHPSYDLVWNLMGPSQVRIVLTQSQSHPSVAFFEAPVPVRLEGLGGEMMDVVLDHSTSGQEFIIDVTFDVSNIVFDPEFDLISANNQVSLGTDDILITDLVVYPNPAQTAITILKPQDLEIEKIRIYNLLGQLIIEKPFSQTILIDQLAAGLHLLQLETSEGLITKSLIKH
ncbi:MAG: T9SS type A sorting domain-containing protein [Flavobacteriaceae bacterium]|nr:T9SS type A sorting domain-containing protein [Flavobacteriaceae bacterium]